MRFTADMSPAEALALTGLDVPEDVERDENGCAVWPLATTAGGYGFGRLMKPGAKQQYVHRLVYEALVAPIPPDWHVDHVWDRDRPGQNSERKPNRLV
jgi:hypothetical protein